VDDGDRNRQGGIAAGRHFDRAGGCLSARRLRGAENKGVGLRADKSRSDQREKCDE
jgi:hypothetical protein